VGYLQQGILVFDNAAERTTALTGNLREGMYSYLKSDNTTYVYDGTAWQRVGKQDVETEKNFQAFTGSGGTTVPAWATKMYYLVVAGGANGSPGTSGSSGSGGAGGQVVQGNATVSGGVTLTVTVGGAGSNSSLAISGGSTFAATGGGGAAGGAGLADGSGNDGADGTFPSAPFNTARFAGGGGGGSGNIDGFGGGGGFSGRNGGGTGGGRFKNIGQNGSPNSGGGGGGNERNTTAAAGTGGSGIVLLYFS
jgi:hypothetical protein